MRVAMRGLDNLQRDMLSMPKKFTVQGARLVRGSAERGNGIASNFARDTSGAHGKHYPDAFDAEMVDVFTWVYGANAAKRQGNMDFEWGSGRQSAPHLPHAKSADVIGPALASGSRKLLGNLFWP